MEFLIKLNYSDRLLRISLVSLDKQQMPDFIEKYINPFTDYSFKRLFGEEPNKELLLDFLNKLLKNERGEITSLIC
jgi:hypothetical protein